MKTNFLKAIDKIMYVVAMAIAFITIAVITYFIILDIMSLLNYSKIIIGSGSYNEFYNILNIVNSFALPIIIIVFMGAIPCLIASIIVFIYFIIRYIKYKEKNIKKMIILLVTLALAIFLLIKGITTYPMTGTYEANINSKISQISNTRMKNFITEQMNNGIAYSNKILKEDYYIYNVKIQQSFPDDYTGVIYYKDGIKKEKRIFVSDQMSYFITNNMQNKTKELSIKGILLLIIGDVLFIVFIVQIRKVLKRIVKGNENINITEN